MRAMIAIAPKKIALVTTNGTPTRRLAAGVSMSTLDRGLRPERPADLGVRFDIRPADEIETIRDCGKNAVERFLDRLGLAGEVQNQRLSANDADLPRQDSGRYVLEAHLAHLLAEPGQQLVRDGKSSLRRHIARRGTRAAGRQHEIAPDCVDELDQGALDQCLLVRNEPRLHAPRRRKRRGEPFLQARDALVLVNAGGG